jgi:hypothetical protein
MNTQPPEWSRLVAASRRAPRDPRDENAPHGFATRVAAHAFSGRSHFLDASMFSRYGLRALGVSLVLAVACVAATLRPVMAAIEDEAAALGETPAQLEITEIS